MKEMAPGIMHTDDDAEVKSILAYYGKVEALAKMPDMARLWLYWPDPEHALFYLACEFRGYPDPIDNGFALTVFDLAILPPEVVAQKVSLMVSHGRDTTHPGRHEYVPPTNTNIN